ncbi:MAG: hypothetical protein K0R61_55 [Microvirga sp.]|jgi:hypothetical protein|nr:hypothetical protein [Microvirga sp.]MDF2969605.1 hypothetical protein [Microvirga sp.]
MQEETLDWLARNGIYAPVDALAIEAANTFIYRGLTEGWYAAAVDFGIAVGESWQAAFEGVKGIYTFAAGQLIGSAPENQLYWGVTFDGASAWNTNVFYDVAGGRDPSGAKFGLGVALTSNLNSVSAFEIGCYEPISDIQVSQQASGGLRSLARLTGGSLTFGDSNSLGVTCSYHTAQGAASLCSSGIITSSATTAVALPHAKLCIGKGGATGNTFSPNTIQVWVDWNEMTDALYLSFLDACNELLVNLGIWDEVQQLAAEPDQGPNAFGKDAIDDVTPLDLTIRRFVTPPATDLIDGDTYTRFPVTWAWSRPIGAVPSSTWTPPRSGGHIEWFWGDRKNVLLPGDPVNLNITPNDSGFQGLATLPKVNNLHCRPCYTTSEKAIGASLTRLAYSWGAEDRDDPLFPLGGYLDYAEAYGLDADQVVANTQAVIDKDTIFDDVLIGYAVSWDWVILPRGREIDLTNFANKRAGCDYESADNRTPAQNLDFHLQAARIVAAQGGYYEFYPHIINLGNGEQAGFDQSNLWQLMAEPNCLCTVVASRRQTTGTIRQSLDAQVDMYRGPLLDKPIDWSKILLLLQIGVGTSGFITVPWAQDCRQWLLDNGVTELVLSGSGSPMGGPLTRNYNQVIATMCGLPTE